jgi:DNA topoisomerase I
MPYIPPGYTGVKVFTDPKSKYYAYGYDKKGRKQILYNSWFIEKQRKKRFKHILNMKAVMKVLKAKIERTLHKKPNVSDKNVQICIILKLMLLCNFRIGNMKYLKSNGSYGLSTLQWSHIHFKGMGMMKIEFIGKKGVLNTSICTDAVVIKLMKQMYKKRGDPSVFQVSSKDVNTFVSEFGITTKDIRTWHANHLYVKYYKQAKSEDHSDDKASKIAIIRVAAALHNTPAVCKKNYLLPELIGAHISVSASKEKKK